MSLLATKVGRLAAGFVRVADTTSASFSRRILLDVSAPRVPWNTGVGFDRAGAVYAWSSIVCTPGVAPVPPTPPTPPPPEEKYLEIAPEIIWVNPEWAVDNDVYSNTTWNID